MKQKHFKNIANSLIFNLIAIYSTFFLGILRIALISRYLTPTEYGYFISSFAILLVFQVIHWFLPPGMNTAILYFLPKLIDNRTSARNLILSVILIRILTICIIGTIYYFSIEILFKYNTLLFYILKKFLSLLILLEFIRSFFSIFIGFQNYKLYAILMFGKEFLIIILLISGIYFCNDSCLDFVINTILFSNFTLFIILLIFLYYIIKKTKISNIKFKFFYKFSEFSNYGLPIALIYFFDFILKDFNNAILAIFKEPFNIVLYSISQNSSQMVLIATGASSHLVSVYSKTDNEATDIEINHIFMQMMKILGFFAIFIMLTIFIFADIYIELIYTNLYSEAILLLRIMLISGFIYFLIDYFSLYFKFKGITNQLLKIKIIISLNWLISSIISIIFLSIIWIVIINTIIQVINLMIFLFYIRKKLFIKKGFMDIFKILSIYLISISVILFFSEYVFLNFASQNLINDIIVKMFNVFLCTTIFLLLNWKLKIITCDLINQIIEFKLFPKMINKVLDKISVLVPSDNKKK